MARVLDMEAGERSGTGDSAAWDLSELCLLPFALMLMLFRAFFGRKLDWLREQRRTRPHPVNWREHHDKLRLAEWSVIEVTAAGLSQLLAGKELNLEGIVSIDPPENWRCPCPRSAVEMHRRIEAVIAFSADPEGRIHRLASRIARLAGGLGSLEVEEVEMHNCERLQSNSRYSAQIRGPPIGDWRSLLQSSRKLPLPIANRLARTVRGNADVRPTASAAR